MSTTREQEILQAEAELDAARCREQAANAELLASLHPGCYHARDHAQIIARYHVAWDYWQECWGSVILASRCCSALRYG